MSTQQVGSLADLEEDDEVVPENIPDLTKIPPANPPAPAKPAPTDPPPTGENDEDEDGDNDGDANTEDAPPDPNKQTPDPSNPPPAPAGDDPIGFYEAVDKLKGRTLEVVYPEGISPETPEGAFIREEALERVAIATYEENLKNNYPRAYDFFLHIKAGKSESEFYKEPNTSLPALDSFQQSVDLQKKVLRQDLIESGLKPNVADIVITQAIEKGTLTDDAQEVYNKRAAKQNADRLAAEQAVIENEKVFNERAMEITSSIKKVVTEDMKFMIPENKRSEFFDFVNKNLQYDDNGFLVTMPLDKTSVADVLKGLYITYSKADLKSVIENSAKQQKVKSLKLSAGAGKGIPPGGQDQPTDLPMVTLGNLWGEED